MPSFVASACPEASIDKKNGSVELPGTKATVNLWLALLLVPELAELFVPEPAVVLELLEHAAAPRTSPPVSAAHSTPFLIAIDVLLCMRCH
jgi:hypothetical protein